jgi:outer membrane autotransporter protein
MQPRHLLVTLLLGGLSAVSANAAEVYFDTVSTAKATRLHGAYVSAYTGANTVQSVATNSRLAGHTSKDATGWSAGVRFGYSFATPIPVRPSVELELGYLNNDINLVRNSRNSYKGGLQSFHGFGNVVLSLDLENHLGESSSDFWRKVKPYIGAGAGMAYARIQRLEYIRDGRRVDDEDGGQISFGYQVFGGVEYAFTDSFSIYGEYKYLSLYDLGGGEVGGADFSEYLIGMKFQY